MRTIMKCKCQFRGKCRYVKKLHAAIYKLEDEYPSITEFDEIIVVQSEESFWDDQLPDAGDSFEVSCGLLKDSSFEHLQWVVTRIYFNLELNNYDEIEDENECTGDCQNDNVASCDDCRCGEECCRRCSGEDEENDEENEGSEDEYEDADNLTRAKMRLENVRSIKYPIEIIDDDDINACALPEGKIQITSAAVANLSEAELAFLIGHEEAHIDKQHSQKKTEFLDECKKGFEVLAEDKEMGGLKKVVSAMAIGVVTIAGAPLVSKVHEIEADVEAKERMIKAGYSEEDATKFFDRLGSYRGRYFSTHPTPQFRKKIIE